MAAPYSTRQSELRKRYHFTCRCSLCVKDGSFIDPRWSIRHVWLQAHCAQIPTAYDSLGHCSCGEQFAVDGARLGQTLHWARDLLAADDRGEYGKLHKYQLIQMRRMQTMT